MTDARSNNSKSNSVGAGQVDLGDEVALVDITRTGNNDENQTDPDASESLGWTTRLIGVFPTTGTGVFTTGILIVGEMAGSGVLALPNAMDDTGNVFIGVFLILLCSCASCYNGTRLGKCWSMVLERYPDDYSGHVRYPYPAIAFRAVGKPMQYVTSTAIEVSLFGVCIVFLLIMSQNTHSLLLQMEISLPTCYILVILWVPLYFLALFGTPKHLWPIGIFASVSTALACLLLLVGMGMDNRDKHLPPHPIRFESLMLAFGAISFSFGGASTFPTIQQDMKNQHDFPKAAFGSYLVMIVMYFPVSVMGFVKYGGAVTTNIISSIPPGSIRITIEVLITIHLFTAYVITLNPLSQHMEEKCKVPNKFCWQRMLLRGGVMLMILFVAETIPHFGPLLDLIGGSTVAFLTFIAPSLYYLQLCRQSVQKLSILTYIVCISIMIFGVLGGIVATYAAVRQLVELGQLVPPCYVNVTAVDDH